MDMNERTDEINSNKRPIYSRKSLEVGFIASSGNAKYYIQSALSIEDLDKIESEKRPLSCIDDSFTKVLITRSGLNPYRD